VATVALEDLLVIWDVDGTLLDARGSGHRALARAITAVTGRPASLANLDVAGQSDRLLLELALRQSGASQRHWQAVREAYETFLDAELSASGSFALPGVVQALSLLGPARVLGTGNLEVGARLKMEHAGLWQHFQGGGFGDRHRSRPPLIRDAVRVGRRLFGRGLVPVIIGDTPRDAAAAQALNMPAVLVASGRFSVDQLSAHGPIVLPGLEDPDAVLRAFSEAEASARRGG
jgi:phosphoglycolate phosphatase